MAGRLQTNPEWLRAVGEGFDRLGASGQAVLIAVSGGADSVGLLQAAASLADGLKMRVGAACIDHGLRSVSAREVELVRSIAEKLGAAFFTQRLPLADGPDLEARARRARYTALEELRMAGGFALIATAHTADDQAETVLMRLGRGASLRGLGAIRARNGNVIRPALCLRRSQLRALAPSFVEDPMNLDPRFLRVRVRGALMPSYEALFPGGVEAAARFATGAAEDEALLTDLAEASYQRLCGDDGSVDLEGLRAAAPSIKKRVLRLLIESAGLSVDARVMEEAAAALECGAQVTLPSGCLLRTSSGAVRVVSGPGTERPAEQPLPPGVWVAHHPSGLEVGVDVDGGSWECPVAAAALRLDVPRAGDRMHGGGAKLQDVLVELRILREARAHLPVVRDGAGRIVCLPGLLKSAQGGPHRVCARLLPGRAAPRWVGRYTVEE